jgi:hypothetical protein
MSYAIDAVFDRAVIQLDREARRLDFLDRIPGASGFDSDGYIATNRALSYVVMGGVLEEFMREIPSALSADLVALRVERRQLPVSIVAAIDAAYFRKCGTDTVTALTARAVLLRDATKHELDSRPVIEFGNLFKLADGTTIGEKHFQALWSLLDLDGDWRNKPNDSLLIKEIREKRNDVAHWTEDPALIGRSKRPSELKQMVTQLIDLISHFQLNIWEWLEKCVRN